MVPRKTNDKITPFTSSLRYYHQPVVQNMEARNKAAGRNLPVAKALHRWLRPIFIILGFVVVAAIASSVFVAFS